MLIVGMPVEDQSVSRLGGSRHLTYNVEAQSVSRLEGGGVSRHLTYPVEAQSVSRLRRSRHLTYPVELRACREWGSLFYFKTYFHSYIAF